MKQNIKSVKNSITFTYTTFTLHNFTYTTFTLDNPKNY